MYNNSYHDSSTAVVVVVVPSTQKQPIHHPPCHVCTIIVQQHYSTNTAEKKKRSKKAETEGFELTLCLSRIERSTAEPKGNVLITCRLREGNFEKSSLAEFGCDARSFAGDREGCCVGETWRGRAVSGNRVALGSRSCFWGML